MKKFIAVLTIALGLVSFTANAGAIEPGEKSILIFADISDYGGTKSTTIFTALDYAINETWTVGVSVFLSKSTGSTTSYGLRGRYHFAIDANVVPYAGAGLTTFKTTGLSVTGSTIEGGVLIPVAEQVDIDVNYARRSFSGFDSTSLTLGVKIKF